MNKLTLEESSTLAVFILKEQGHIDSVARSLKNEVDKKTYEDDSERLGIIFDKVFLKEGVGLNTEYEIGITLDIIGRAMDDAEELVNIPNSILRALSSAENKLLRLALSPEDKGD